jgi:hypothetical protein
MLDLSPLRDLERAERDLDRWLPAPKDPSLPAAQRTEWEACEADPVHFISHHVRIYDAVLGTWIPFALWPDQQRAVRELHDNRLVIILKARQIGMTWTVLAYALWLMVFHPAAEIGVFSRRETEAVYLLSAERLRGMHVRLPGWMRKRVRSATASAKMWKLGNGSVARAFPTSAGDSYSFTLVIADEFDLAPDQNNLMRATKPTIDNGGRMVLLSRVDKKKPHTEFKRIYRAAKQKLNGWKAIFLPWTAHPARDAAWYQTQKDEIQNRTGSLDDLHEQYPATDTEALSPRVLDKRIPPTWIEKCYDEREPLPAPPPDCPAIPGLEIYALPEAGREYVISADPAEGNPSSDPSASTVIDVLSGEEMAVIEGRFEVTTFASYVDQLGTYYNMAAVLPERNNHGHAFIAWMLDNSELSILEGYDGKAGWLSNSKGKALLYATAAEAFRDGDTILHSFASYVQLSSIDGSTLRAPEGDHDDRADSYALCLVGAVQLAGNWLLG